MIVNQYRLTLYNTSQRRDILTFDYPLLPNIDELIDVNGIMFTIKERAYIPKPVNGLIEVMLLGISENDR